MVPFSNERRSGRDRRAGADRRQLDRRQDQNGEEREAYEEDLERAAEMTAHLGEVWHGKGRDFFDRKKYEDAEKALRKALEIKPDIAEAWFLLACIESGRGKKEVALSSLARALELEPEYRSRARSHSLLKKYQGDGDFEKILR
jgi:tetratricopeptide (TPR) repeat protein